MIIKYNLKIYNDNQYIYLILVNDIVWMILIHLMIDVYINVKNFWMIFISLRKIKVFEHQIFYYPKKLIVIFNNKINN